MIRIPVIEAPRQVLSMVLNTRRCTIGLNYNTLASRWMLDLSIDAVPVLAGRRVVTGVDLLAPFEFGIGLIIAGGYDAPDTEPNYQALTAGTVRLYHITQDEAAALTQ